jgi:hypothetical protein
MKIMNSLRKFVWGGLVVAALLSASSAFAQTALTTTTLGALVADGSSLTVTVASATGITAPGTGANFVYLLVDKELLAVRNVNGTAIGVARGQNGTRATPHINGSAVTIAPAIAIVNYTPSGQCVRANLLYVPIIVGGTLVQAHNGDTFDCLGATTAGQLTQTNANGVATLGATMASVAGVLGAFTGQVLTVSGTLAITGFTNPAGIQPGFAISIVPSGIFTWTAANNIALAGTAVVNKLLVFVWNGSKWVPNYIA